MQMGITAEEVRNACGTHIQAGNVHEADFLYFRELGADAVFLDVGANIGNSINSLISVGATPQLHAFEPNQHLWPAVLDILNRYGAPSSLHLFGLSDSNSDFELHVPYVDGRPILGEASIEADHFNDPTVRARLISYGTFGSLTFQSVPCRLRRLDDIGLRPTHIKIDVEGHELAALKGMKRTLAERRPLLLIEMGWSPPILEFLTPLGYTPRVYDPAAGLLKPLGSATPLNVFFTS